MQFKRLGMRNFKAIGEADINIEQQGFVAIRGINNTDPNTANCGTGKSSIADAFNWVLTNTTVKGGTDVKNIYTDGDCAVSVEFEKGGKAYQIVRVKGKSLQLIENGNDISGKGIRDTQALIEQMFPEFTPEFIGATLIFGQKQPNAFTANSASKRKEILEKLTNSDFQIDEIKERLTRKKDENAKAQRTAEDELLSKQVAYRETQRRHGELVTERTILVLPDEIESQIEMLMRDKITCEEEVSKAEIEMVRVDKELDELQKHGTELGDKLRAYEKEQAERKERELAEAQREKDVAIATARAKSEQVLKEIREQFATKKERKVELEVAVSTENGKATLAEGNVRATERELKKAEAELDRIEKSTVCPTCGKPWGDDEHKVDLAPYHEKIADAKSALDMTIVKFNVAKDGVRIAEDCLDDFKWEVEDWNRILGTKESEQSEEIIKVEQREQIKINGIKEKWSADSSANEMIYRLTALRQSYADKKAEREKTVECRLSIENSVKSIVRQITANELRVAKFKEKSEELDENIRKILVRLEQQREELEPIEQKIDNCKTRADQLNKLYNFAIKKFRTILLEDTIIMFEERAKAIAQKYFGVDITFKQDGANIEITYQGKQFENLSGGEECAAVLVIQTALRELLFDLTGEESNMLFVDECTDGADIALSEKIMTLVGDYNTESVFIISHHGELNLPTDRTMVVEKNNNIADVHWE